MATCGIYKIESPVGEVYIGQSVRIKYRWRAYKTLNCKNQKRIYNSFLAYGVHNHIFTVIHELPIDVGSRVMNDYESLYMDLYRSAGVTLLNSTAGGWSKGPHSIETRLKISKSNKGRKLTKERIAAIIKQNTGLKRTDEFKKQVSDKLKGRKFSDEHKRKIGEKAKGRPKTPESIQKQREKHTGYKLPPEKRLEWSINRTGSGNSFYGKKQRPESIAKQIETKRARGLCK